MNKRLKHIIAATLVVSAFTTIVPAKYINLGVANAYASSSISKDEFDDLVVCKGSSSKELQLYSSSSCKDSDEVDFKFNTKTYYVKISGSTNSVTIDADVDGDYEAYVFKGNKDKAYDLGEEIKVGSGTTTLYVRIYEDGEFDEDDVEEDVARTYKIYVKNRSSSDDEDSKSDNIYLKDITLSDGDINFSEKKTSYDINVAESVESIKIKAIPEDDDYTVEIDGDTVDDGDKYKKEVDLKKGKNTIKINIVDDDDNKRTYTLNITRGVTSTSGNQSTSNNTNNNNQDSNTVKPSTPSDTNKKCDQWVNNSGKWQYNDSNGNVLKNRWHSDKSSGKWYYLDQNGYMKTGWLKDGELWYYLDDDGSMKIGWLLSGSDWYYLNSNGSMHTGWLQSGSNWYFINRNTGVMKSNGWIVDNGKYYYFSSSGMMLSNVTINGYILGKDGAWIGR
ncbi:cadherin-like beta sandwich domain-containing protein [uncultured Clostridium sp.]|uniref:cadherin-like beta sandwich domain-containing protein n=1 Tax=uncultured Clostridium sp. TaxID=59620 RepID=UPI0028EC490F|nr:cadherin-like beta sandwich domain-containing protein [uncultured Clostridium sp.]